MGPERGGKDHHAGRRGRFWGQFRGKLSWTGRIDATCEDRPVTIQFDQRTLTLQLRHWADLWVLRGPLRALPQQPVRWLGLTVRVAVGQRSVEVLPDPPAWLRPWV